MKISNQPKARMHAAKDSVDTGASQGARRATEDAPVSARPLSPSIDSEVVAIAKRRSRTNADKRRIVLAAAACTKPGEIGALMRREGVYSSALATWRRQYAAGELSGAESKKRGPKAAPAPSCDWRAGWQRGKPYAGGRHQTRHHAGQRCVRTVKAQTAATR